MTLNYIFDYIKFCIILNTSLNKLKVLLNGWIDMDQYIEQRPFTPPLRHPTLYSRAASNIAQQDKHRTVLCQTVSRAVQRRLREHDL